MPNYRDMRVLALASYPIEAAATRYRLAQFVGPLAERGIALDVRPFLDARLFAALYRRGAAPRTALGLMGAAVQRIGDVAAAHRADVVLVQREAMLFGPPIIEWLVSRLGNRPMVLDLDDATYLRYTSPTYGRLTGWLKWFGKTDDLIRWARLVVCGNRSIAGYVTGKGSRAVVIPTVVDTDRFRPPAAPAERPIPVIGWIGSHSTYPYLESILPALERLARAHRFRLRVIGSGREAVRIPGVSVECEAWSLNRELEDFQSLDIGLYPVRSDEWAAGKSGFKAIQYMAAGIPFVVTPVGACAEIGEPGVTHLCASSQDEWCEALAALLSDAGLRRCMGEAGRRHVVQHYALGKQADLLAHLFKTSIY